MDATTESPPMKKGRPGIESGTAPKNISHSNYRSDSAEKARMLISLVSQTRLQPAEAEAIVSLVYGYAAARVAESGGAS